MYFGQVRMEINKVLGYWKDAWDADDADSLARLYAPEATYLAPAVPVVQRRDSIRSYFASFLTPVGSVDVRMVDFGMSGDLAYVTTRVTYHVNAQASNMRQRVRTDLIVL